MSVVCEAPGSTDAMTLPVPEVSEFAGSVPETNLLDECDAALASLNLQEIQGGFGETSELSCEEAYFANRALARRTQLMGRKRIV